MAKGTFSYNLVALQFAGYANPFFRKQTTLDDFTGNAGRTDCFRSKINGQRRVRSRILPDGNVLHLLGPIRKTAEAEARVVFENFDGGGTGGQRAISSKQPIIWKRFVPMTPSARTCDFGSGGYSERVCRNSN
jgi:hypothetical protein